MHICHLVRLQVAQFGQLCHEVEALQRPHRLRLLGSGSTGELLQVPVIKTEYSK